MMKGVDCSLTYKIGMAMKEPELMKGPGTFYA